MKNRFEGIEPETVDALLADRQRITGKLGALLTLHESPDAMAAAMADRMITDYQSAIQDNNAVCVMIAPVGPVGQYDIIAERCIKENLSLSSLILIAMDEYLDFSGRWIDIEDPLSFRGHIQRHLIEKLPLSLQPQQVAVPDPSDLEEIPRLIKQHGGVDVCYAGVGITGHIAFNDPEPGLEDTEWFSNLPTRVVRLLPETRLINSVTAAGGNTLRIPYQAVTIGMREILSARLLRIWLNRDWQRAAVRRMLFGPITARFPASLVQNHPHFSLDLTESVLEMPESLLA